MKLESKFSVKVESLSYSYGDRKALDGLSFQVANSEIFGFLGPNGGGKTTTFKILSTLFTIEKGQVEIFEMDLSTHRNEIRKKMGVVFQAPALDKKLKVFENLEHQGRLYGLSGAELKKRIYSNLEKLGLHDRIYDRVETLSGGLQRRVELAKALLNEPMLLILDEPSTGLDPAARHEFWKHLETLRKEKNISILITTHYLEEADRCDRILILNQGKNVALGSPHELKSQVGSEVLRIYSQNTEALKRKILEDYKIACNELDGFLQIEKDNAHQWISKLFESYSNEITSITLGLPTLEDVFIQKTGKRFQENSTN